MESGGELTLAGSHDDVVARDVCANDAHADVLVGIYFDAGSSPQNAGSLTAYDDARPFAAANERLATLVQHDVLADMNAQGWQIPDDGVLPDTSLGSFVGDASDGGIAGAAAAYDHLLLLGPAQAGYFTNPSEMPGAVIEPLYLTDPFEGSIADTTHGQTVIARGLARAIETFLKGSKVSRPPEPTRRPKSRAPGLSPFRRSRGPVSGRSPVSTSVWATSLSFMFRYCEARRRTSKAWSAGIRSRSIRMPCACPMISRLLSAECRLSMRRSSSSYKWAAARAALANDDRITPLALSTTPKAEE